MIGLMVLAAALVAALVLAVVYRRTNGTFRDRAPQEIESDADRVVVTSVDIDAELGERVTLLQFSSAFCAPCRATRRVLAEVADVTPGVTHVEIDAESHLDLVRQLGVMRTPTVLVLDADGTVTRRASGLPRRDQVLSAVAAAV